MRYEDEHRTRRAIVLCNRSKRRSSFGVNQIFFLYLKSLRSVGRWSSGRNETEESIHHALIDMITNAKYYIYIENQFFVSLIGDSTVRNGIAEALFKRILRAHQ